MSDSSCWLSVFNTIIECLLSPDQLIQVQFIFPSILPEHPQLVSFTYGSLLSPNSQETLPSAPTSASAPAPAPASASASSPSSYSSVITQSNQPLNETNKIENEEVKSEEVNIDELTQNNIQFSFLIVLSCRQFFQFHLQFAYKYKSVPPESLKFVASPWVQEGNKNSGKSKGKNKKKTDFKSRVFSMPQMKLIQADSMRTEK